MDLRIFLMVVLVSIIAYGLFEIYRRSKQIIALNSSIDEDRRVEDESIATMNERYSAKKVLAENAVISTQELNSNAEQKPSVTLMQNNIIGSTVNILKPTAKFTPGDIIAIHIFPENKKTINGKILYLALKNLDLVFSEDGVFHKVESVKEGLQAQYTLAVAKEPGTFDLDKMFVTDYEGVVLFMLCSGPSSPLFAFEEMLSAARKLSCKLMANICDASHKKLTPSSIECFREKVRENQRKRVFNKEEALEV